MTDYKKLVKELRGCKDMDYCTDCPRMANGYVEFCNIKVDAAAAIEALQAEVDKREGLINKALDDNADLEAEVDALKHDIERYVQMNTELLNDRPELEEIGGKWVWKEPKRGEMVEVVRCKDCKHRPTGTGVNNDIEFPDARCPCQCYEDYWYSWMPSDDWYCGNGEKMEVQDG